jgi:hypothetical protein
MGKGKNSLIFAEIAIPHNYEYQKPGFQMTAALDQNFKLFSI